MTGKKKLTKINDKISERKTSVDVSAALRYASFMGDYPKVLKLVENGANLLVNNIIECPLYIAAVCAHQEIVDYLLPLCTKKLLEKVNEANLENTKPVIDEFTYVNRIILGATIGAKADFLEKYLQTYHHKLNSAHSDSYTLGEYLLKRIIEKSVNETNVKTWLQILALILDYTPTTVNLNISLEKTFVLNPLVEKYLKTRGLIFVIVDDNKTLVRSTDRKILMEGEIEKSKTWYQRWFGTSDSDETKMTMYCFENRLADLTTFINDSTKVYLNALHLKLGIYQNNNRIVRLLLENGLKINCKSSETEVTSLDLAISNDSIDVIDSIIKGSKKLDSDEYFNFSINFEVNVENSLKSNSELHALLKSY